jgi:plastocyanin
VLWRKPVILATGKEEIGRIAVPDQSRQNVSKTLISINKPGAVTYTCDPNHSGGTGGRITVRDHL